MSVTAADRERRLPARTSGASLSRHVFTPAEINRRVDELLTADLSNVRNCVLELIFHFIVLTESTLFTYVSKQVAISENIETFTRRLRQYRADGLLATVSQDALKSVKRAGLPESKWAHLRAYQLGPVGEEYVKRKGWNGNVPIASVSENVLVHDLICAETMLHMSELWLFHPTSPGVVEVRGPREVLVWDAEKKAAVIAPDGLFIKRSKEGVFERAFLVEYQNVRALLQVQNKLKKYEAIARPEHRWVWDAWGLDAMPFVLVIHRQGSTLKHYQEEIAGRGEMAARFASISLEDVWAGNLSIKPIR
jgi:hypothetical protein